MKNYFKNCQELNDAKKLYWELAKQLHPDVGGTKEAFQELQNEFENFKPAKEKFKNEFEQWKPQGFMDIIDQLIKIQGIVITVCGSWIWLSGNTKPVKELIKAVSIDNTGFKRGFSKNKLQWYFSPEGYRKKSKRKMSFDDIKNVYGYQGVEKSEGYEVYDNRLTA